MLYGAGAQRAVESITMFVSSGILMLLYRYFAF
jgi:hypothetical protein